MLDRLWRPIDRLGYWLLDHPETQVRIWVVATLAWLVLTPLTMLTFLRGSIPWVAFMSLFANTASCATALVAALAFARATSADRKATHVIDNHPSIPPLLPGRATGR